MLPDKCIKRRSMIDNMNMPFNNRDVCKKCAQAKVVDKYFENGAKNTYLCKYISQDVELQKRAAELRRLMNQSFKQAEIETKDNLKNLFALTYANTLSAEAA